MNKFDIKLKARVEILLGQHFKKNKNKLTLSASNENIPRTQIGDPEGIVVQLGNPYLINKIILILYDRDNRNMAYSIEVRIFFYF